ncbi:hypothetical protein ACA910_017187 [Epithemia clementina (nom. ined.)]
MMEHSRPPSRQQQQPPNTPMSYTSSQQHQEQASSSSHMPQQLQMPPLDPAAQVVSPPNSTSNGCYSVAENMVEMTSTATVPVVVDDADIAAGKTNLNSSGTGTTTFQYPYNKDKQVYGSSADKQCISSSKDKEDLLEEQPFSSNSNHYYTGPVTCSNKYNNNVALPPRSATTSYASFKGSVASSGVYPPSDLEFFEDLVSEPVLVLGVDISHLDRNSQFFVCASGVFGFSLLYGYLQELISVKICGRQLGLFLAMVQFAGYTILAFFLRNFVYAKEQRRLRNKKQQRGYEKQNYNKKDDDEQETSNMESATSFGGLTPQAVLASPSTALSVPVVLYLGLSILRAIDLGMTNMAMQYINYPAKTLMKSSRVVFTMLFGVVISRKKYKLIDYAIVMAMVAGLALFMHADANSSAVFDLAGVLMLTVSLLCDGAISNVSESIMSKFGVGQDEFIFRVYSIALVAITGAAMVKGDFIKGFVWLLQPGTYDEQDKPIEERTWTVMGKVTVIILFSSMGFFGSSCSAAITKNFGALTMSITSTARKAATLFLSFFLFNNVCTFEHIMGVIVFIAALTAKSLRRKGDTKSSHKSKSKVGQGRRHREDEAVMRWLPPSEREYGPRAYKDQLFGNKNNN